MNSDLVTVLNTVTGRVGKERRNVLDHPVFGKTLTEVEPGTKFRVSSLHRPQTVEEYTETHPTTTDAKAGDDEKVFDPIIEDKPRKSKED